MTHIFVGYLKEFKSQNWKTSDLLVIINKCQRKKHKDSNLFLENQKKLKFFLLNLNAGEIMNKYTNLNL